MVTLRVYNTLGQQVRELVNSEQGAGSYKVTFDMSGLASGIYVYALHTPLGTLTKTMVILK
jgi:hypothetical protein